MAKKFNPKNLESIVSDESKNADPIQPAPAEAWISEAGQSEKGYSEKGYSETGLAQIAGPAVSAAPVAPVPQIDNDMPVAPAASVAAAKPKRRRRGAVSPFDGLLRENNYTPFPLSDDDAFIQYNDSENQVRIRWDPYSEAHLYIQRLAKNIEIEAPRDFFKQGFVLKGWLGRKLAGYGFSADDINSIHTKLENQSKEDITLKFNDPTDTNYYVLPFGKLSENGKPVNVICDRKQLRAIALYSKRDKRPSNQFHAGLGLNIAPIIRWVGHQKEITDWVTKVGSKTASGYAIIAVPDKTQVNMVSPGGSVETVKGQVYAYTDNLELKVLGVGSEWALAYGLAAAGGAAGMLLAPTIALNPVTTAAIGLVAGGYVGNLIASINYNTTVGDYLRQAGIGAIGGVGGAGLTYLALTAGAATAPWLLPMVFAAEGALIGHAAGRVISSAAVNPENNSLIKRLGAGLYFTEEKLHTLAMKNDSTDYGFCITS